MTKREQGKRISELDALRGIAAVYVVLFHFSLIAGYDIPFLKAGSTGVDLFFLISGYVILMTLEKTNTSYEFIVSRLSRLYPSYITMFLLTLVVIFTFTRPLFPSGQTILSNLTMLQPFFKAPYIDDSYWTLTVEMEFYILMLLIFMAGWLQKIEFTGAILLFLIFSFHWIGIYFFSGAKIYNSPRVFFPLLDHFHLFFSGILFYKLKNAGKNKYSCHILIGICFFISLFLCDKTGRAHFFINRTSYTISIIFYFLAFYLFVFDKLSFLKGSIFSWLGTISYCLYLVHQHVGKILFPYLLNALGISRILAVSILFLGMILLAAVVTYTIEKPAIRFIRAKLLAGKKPTVSPVSGL